MEFLVYIRDFENLWRLETVSTNLNPKIKKFLNTIEFIINFK